jgi:hypothetical protein
MDGKEEGSFWETSSAPDTSATSASRTPHSAKLGAKVMIRLSIHAFLKHSRVLDDALLFFPSGHPSPIEE